MLGATLGWVDTLKRRIREIRGLYGHVTVGMDMLGVLRPEKTHVTQDAACYAGCAGCCLLRRMRRMLPVTQDAQDAACYAGCAGQPSPLVPVQLLPLSA